MFSKKYRLSVKEFNKVLNSGKSFSSHFFYLKILRNDLGFIRIGVAVSKKLGKASVHKNYYKRVLRSLLKLSLPSMATGHDIVLIAKENIKNRRFQELEKDATELLQKTIR